MSRYKKLASKFFIWVPLTLVSSLTLACVSAPLARVRDFSRYTPNGELARSIFY